jgi:hypothetical protein
VLNKLLDKRHPGKANKENLDIQYLQPPMVGANLHPGDIANTAPTEMTEERINQLMTEELPTGSNPQFNQMQ